VAHFVLPNDILCLREVRRLINYLPSNNQQKPPILDLRDPLERTDPALDYLVPANPNHTYDMKVLIHSVMDGAEFMEIQPQFARNVICGLGRLGGQTVGLIANQPAVLAGVLDINASAKAARFVRFCDAFNIPLVCFVDVPGFMPGPEQESGGIIRHGAKLLYAFVEASVPRITVILRKDPPSHEWTVTVDGVSYAVTTPEFEFYRRQLRLEINGRFHMFRLYYQ
jgi:propionyl-CoA carboxylase beta chain